jgi:hypothetical protein
LKQKDSETASFWGELRLLRAAELMGFELVEEPCLGTI